MPKIFIVSLHRTATRSTHDLFEQAGVSAIHWPVMRGGVDYQALIAGRETDAGHIAATLKPFIETHEALSDVPFCGIYEVLAELYPQARFLAMSRPAADWISSARRHVGARRLDPYEKAVYWRYLPTRPECITDVTDRELSEMHRLHHEGLRAYFAGTDRFAQFDMLDPQAGEKVCVFARLPIHPLPHIGAAEKG